MRKIAWTALIFILLLGGIAIAVWDDIPRWGVGGTYTAPASSVAGGEAVLTCPAAGTSIAIFGDSHVVGGRMGSDAPPYGKVLEGELGNDIAVRLFGSGGHTALQGEARKSDLSMSADLVLIAYGTNDAAPRGWLSSKQAVPVKRFEATLIRLVERWRAADTKVVLVAPPPGGSWAISDRLQPYRKAVGRVGAAKKVAVIDPTKAFARCSGSEPLLVRDALHMNARGHQCLGKWIAQQMCGADR